MRLQGRGDGCTAVANLQLTSFDHLSDLIERLRSAVDIALDFSAAFVSQEGSLLVCFDAVGTSLHSEAMAKPENRMNYGASVGVTLKIAHKRTVDLDFIEREAPKRSEAG